MPPRLSRMDFNIWPSPLIPRVRDARTRSRSSVTGITSFCSPRLVDHDAVKADDVRAATAPCCGASLTPLPSRLYWWVIYATGKQPFALVVQGRIRLRRNGNSNPIYEARFDASSESALTTEEWNADQSVAVRNGLDQSLRTLAYKMASDLAQSTTR